MRYLGICFLAFMTSAAAQGAGPAATEPAADEATVAALSRQLASDGWRERAAGARKLARLGSETFVVAERLAASADVNVRSAGLAMLDRHLQGDDGADRRLAARLVRGLSAREGPQRTAAANILARGDQRIEAEILAPMSSRNVFALT